MSEVTYREKRFLYLDGDREQILIDLRRCMENKSRIPIINSQSHPKSVMRLILELQEQHSACGLGEDSSFDYMLLDFLAARCLMRTAAPLRVAEIGAMTGEWSFHLASMMGQYNEMSTLCSVCNAVGNESGNVWLDRIALVAEPPKLSMLAADYDDTMLADGNFDLVALNGTAILEKPYQVLKEAERLVKTGGVILCYVRNQKELSAMFEKIFSGFETFVIDSCTRAYYLEYQGQSWNDPAYVSCREEAEAYMAKLSSSSLKMREKKELRGCYQKLEDYIDMAMKERLIDLKVKLIQCQELVLDAMYPVKS